MNGTVVVDANLLVLLVVGSTSPSYVAIHKRLKDTYSYHDFELLGLIIAEFSELILLPHILAEVSNLSRQIANPARGRIQEKLKTLIKTAFELPVPSAFGVERQEFEELGLTDAVILHLCSMEKTGLSPTLVTVDSDLANRANSLGLSVIDYRSEYQTK